MATTLKRCTSDPIVYIQLFVYKKIEKELQNEENLKNLKRNYFYVNISKYYFSNIHHDGGWQCQMIDEKISKKSMHFFYIHTFLSTRYSKYDRQ